MADLTNAYVYGLREVQIVSHDATPITVALNASRVLSFSEEYTEADLEGNDVVVASVGFPKKLTWELEAGGVPLEAISIMTGEAIVDDGTPPDSKQEMVRHAGTSSPYFTIRGRSLGDSGDDIEVQIPNAKLGGFEGSFEFETFTLTKCNGSAIDDGTQGLYSVTTKETAAPLS